MELFSIRIQRTFQLVSTNHRQEVWKTPLPQFIEDIYFKRFKREEPETVKPLKQIMAEMEVKKKQQKAKKEERRKQRALSSGSEE